MSNRGEDSELQKFKNLVGDTAVVPHLQSLSDCAMGMQCAKGRFTFEARLQEAIEHALAMTDALIKVRDATKYWEDSEATP